MTVFNWKEEYCVGDALIDSQHQYLFVLGNDVVDSKDKAELTDNVMKLFRYVREHFDHEEAVMRNTGYPAYRDHVALHEKLISQLSQISSDIAKDLWSVTDLQKFMNEWLLSHIAKEDTKLANFIRGQYVARC